MSTTRNRIVASMAMVLFIAALGALFGYAFSGDSKTANDLTGTWESVEESNSVALSGSLLSGDVAVSWDLDESMSDPYMTAIVTHDTIEVTWGGSVRSLYWKGTFPQTHDVPDGTIIASTGDTKTMDASLMASQDDQKEFLYEDGQLKFDLTVMGATTTIVLEKV